MILDDNNEMMADVQREKGRKAAFRMASVTSLTEAGRPVVQFFGERTPAARQYKYLASYTPAIGDTVLMAQINGNYVIVGKVM